jgi:CTP:molybdopterin cytidylyltransferase MocA
MKVVAVIPCRMGSQRLERKNLCEVAFRPLVWWACDSALRSGIIDEVVVSTDEPSMVAPCLPAGVACIKRPVEISGPTADIATAVQHAVEGRDPDYVVTLQPAVMARSPAIIDALVRGVIAEGANGGLTMATSVPWQWTLRGAVAGNAWHPGPYPRSQDSGHRMAEINAVQVASAEAVANGQRWGLPLVVAELPAWAASLDIDDEDDLHTVRDMWLFAWPRLQAMRPRLRIIRGINGETA